MRQHPRWTEVTLAAELRRRNQAYDGPGEAVVDARGELHLDVQFARAPWQHYERIPGDGGRFDHLAAARRLLAAWRDSRGQLELFK